MLEGLFCSEAACSSSSDICDSDCENRANEKLEIRLFENGMVVLGLATSHDSQIDSKRVQVRPGDQPGYPKDTIESFVGHSSMGLLCPPASTT